MSYGTVQAEKMTTESGYSLGAGNASSFKNRIINGSITIDQRNNGSAVSVVSSYAYPVERCRSFNAASARWNAQRVTEAPVGFSYSFKVTVTTAQSSYGAAELSQLLEQPIEGFNISDLGWGTASAKAVTVSFWVRSSITGNHPLSVFTLVSGNERSYATTYNIASANTWEYKTVTIPGATTGVWGSTNDVGLYLAFVGMAGSNNTGVAGWQTGFKPYQTGSVNILATNGATWQVTGLQLEKAEAATAYEHRPFGTELALCQRYCEANYGVMMAYIGYKMGGPTFVVPKRAVPSIKFYTGVDLTGTVGSIVESNTTGSNYVVTGSGASTSAITIIATSYQVTTNMGFSFLAEAEL
jgi:hypothetical protein